MTTWGDVMEYCAQHWPVLDRDADSITVMFPLENGRTQTLQLLHWVGENREVVQLTAPFSRPGRVDDWPQLLEACGRLMFGGAVVKGDIVALVHTVLLGDLQLRELQIPALHLAVTADELEQRYLATDLF